MLVSKLILGTVQLGIPYGVNNFSGQPSLEEAFEILNLAYDFGLRSLDTAEAYGESQSIIGAFHSRFPHKRFDVFTKFQNDSKLLELKINNNLKKLNVSSVGLYSFHDPYGLRDKSLCDQLEALKRKELVRNIGVSIYKNEEFREAIYHPIIDVIQIPFNLLDNWAKRGDLILEAKANGKTIHCRSIFLQGLFQKDLENFPAKLMDLRSSIKFLLELSSISNISITELAMRYVSHIKYIDNILVGVEKTTQLSELLSFSQSDISNNIRLEIDRLDVNSDLLDPRSWG